MTVFLPDTSTLIDALNGRRDRKKLLYALVALGHSLACCAVTIAELYAGLRPDEVARAEELVSVLIWTDTSFTVARRAGELRRRRPDFAALPERADAMLCARDGVTGGADGAPEPGYFPPSFLGVLGAFFAPFFLADFLGGVSCAKVTANTKERMNW